MAANSGIPPGLLLAFRLGGLVSHLPLSFTIASMLGPGYFLRCVNFHDISDKPSEFTDGIGVALGTKEFEARIKFISRHYTPVKLDEVVAGLQGRKFKKPPILVTFDDAYASVKRNAAPVLERYGIPAVFFVTALMVGSEELGTDNLICYVANHYGMDMVCNVAKDFVPGRPLQFANAGQVIAELLPGMSQTTLAQFRAVLQSAAGVDSKDLARKAGVYISKDELRQLTNSGFEIGNHTYSHVFCRTLTATDMDREISANKTKLEEITGTPVRAFSVPYGSGKDLDANVEGHLRDSGHEAVFLVESRTNTSSTDLFRLNRVSIYSKTDAEFFSAVEILPRLRSLRDSFGRLNFL